MMIITIFIYLFIIYGIIHYIVLKYVAFISKEIYLFF